MLARDVFWPVIPLPVRKGLGSIHTSFRNKGPLRYNLVKLLLQCTNGTQTQTGGGWRGRGEGPYPLERATRLRRQIAWKGASSGAASFPGGLHDPVMSWWLRGLTHPQKCQRALHAWDFTQCPLTQMEWSIFIQEICIISSNLSYF